MPTYEYVCDACGHSFDELQSFSDQRFVDVNQRLAEVAGCKREEMIGRTAAELFLWDKPALADQWYEALARKELIRAQEAKIRSQTQHLSLR